MRATLKPTCFLKQRTVKPRVTNPSVVFVDGKTRFVCMNNKDSIVHYQVR